MKTSNLIFTFLLCFFSLSTYNIAVATDSQNLGLTAGMSMNEAESLLSPPSCPVPTWLMTTNITNNSATFSWDPMSGAITYSVQTRVPNGTWYTVPGSPTPNISITVDWFLHNTTYEWRVRSNCANGEYSNWSPPVTFTTLGWGNCDAPAWLFTNNITYNSANLDWEPASGAESYSLQYRVIGGGSWIYVPGGPWTETWHTLTGLQSGTTYEWRVRSNCANSMYSEWSYAASFTTLGGGYCGTPGWLFTNNITNNSANLDWDPVSGAQSYSLQYRQVNGGSWINVPGGPWTETWHILTGLQAGTTYEWRVRSNCANWEYSAWSYPAVFTTLGWGYCDAPAWLYTNNVTYNSATLDWDPVSSAQSYSLQYRVIGGGSWIDVPGGPWTETWHTLTGLQPGTTYEWRVRSNCPNWEYSAWSYPASFTTLYHSCYAPTWLYTTNITNSSAQLNWDYVSGAQNYTIQLRVWGGSWYDLPGGPFNGNWHTATGLQPSTTYEWRIRSNCSYWNYSVWSYPQTFTTGGGYCSVPTWPSTWDIAQNSATFSWSHVSGAYNYVVQIRQDNGDWYEVSGSPTNATWLTVWGLNSCTSYQWRVKAHCGNWQYSNWTQPVYFTTTCTYYCHAPSWLYTNNITETSATLDWDPVYGAMSYSVQIRVAGGNWEYVPGGPFTETWTSVSWLLPMTNYEWRVRANCNNWTYSDWSYPAHFKTLGNSCHRPSHLFTLNITSYTATLDWSSVFGAWSYAVQIREINGPWTNVPGSPFTETQAEVTDLTPGTTYQWRVKTNCENDNYSLWTKPATFKTPPIPTCDAPYWLLTNNITESSGNLDWSPIYGAASYSMQWRQPGGDWIDIPAGVWTETWYTLTGLLPGTDYEWRVRTHCLNSLVSEWSTHAAFTTDGPSCAVPEGAFSFDVTDTTATVSWLAVPYGESYMVQVRVPYGVWITVEGGPFTETEVIIGDLIPGTYYEWRVRANCINGDHSDWTALGNFTTTGTQEGGSDECDDATILTVNSSCQQVASSNVGSTESSPEPMGWCASNKYKDVWFRFEMPNVADPIVTIRTIAGTLTDGIMELYRGSDCNSLEYIFCEDDNSLANGSTMPVLTITGNANETIWVRVWGYAGTTGSFGICVFDYESSNYAAPVESISVTDGEIINFIKTEIASDPLVDLSTGLHISPNPARDILNVTYHQTEQTEVRRLVIRDMSGKVVFTEEYNMTGLKEFTTQVNVSGFTPEMYLLQVITTKGILTEKVVIAR